MKSKKINNVLIMAAGRGIRMMPLTKKIPKAMAPMRGSTLIAKGIKKVQKYFNNVHITVGYKGELLAKHVTELNVDTILNTKNKGNSWWMYNSLLKNLNEPIFVLTCDNLYNMSFNFQLKEYFKIGNPACMIVPANPIDNYEGDYISHKNNNIIRISRQKRTNLMCSGIQILNPARINKITNQRQQFIQVWKQLIDKKEIKISSKPVKNWHAIDNLMQLKKFNNAKR
tara:strand:- start:426 stop:1106 length:681 start_codon:yes stop_codon:yes gene_type:complete